MGFQSPIYNPLAEIHWKTNRWVWLLIFSFFVYWVKTLIFTTDLANWALENILTVLSLVFFTITIRRFQFSNLSYSLIASFLLLHVYGSQYTYAENPFGYWMMHATGDSRNQYDRLVHFSSGLLLAYPVMELSRYWLMMRTSLARFMPLLFALSTGAAYELLEWGIADIFFRKQGPAYLGLQGDVWDAQKDIALAALGAVLGTAFAIVFPSRSILAK
jgi:putative membrane protein